MVPNRSPSISILRKVFLPHMCMNLLPPEQLCNLNSASEESSKNAENRLKLAGEPTKNWLSIDKRWNCQPTKTVDEFKLKTRFHPEMVSLNLPLLSNQFSSISIPTCRTRSKKWVVPLYLLVQNQCPPEPTIPATRVEVNVGALVHEQLKWHPRQAHWPSEDDYIAATSNARAISKGWKL